MARRLHIHDLHPGVLTLDSVQAHHARQVLRLMDGDEVELFDDVGRVARAVIVGGDSNELNLRVDAVQDAAVDNFSWIVAAAVPKGERADWMVEKLSELGCHTFVPLIAERSVVTPKGTGKHDRWVRLATESAKQCRRRGVMQIAAPTPLDELLRSKKPGDHVWFFDTGPTAIPVRQLLLNPRPSTALTVLIGPEGGWSPTEVDQMLEAHLVAVALTTTILRIETAAVAAGTLVSSFWAGAMPT